MSRSLILKTLPAVSKNKLLLQNKGNFVSPQIIIRNSHGGELYYRTIPPVKPTKNKIHVFFGAVMWWWIFWNLFTEPHYLTGHKYPDPSKWTDEELGIPEE